MLPITINKPTVPNTDAIMIVVCDVVFDDVIGDVGDIGDVSGGFVKFSGTNSVTTV